MREDQAVISYWQAEATSYGAHGTENTISFVIDDTTTTGAAFLQDITSCAHTVTSGIEYPQFVATIRKTALLTQRGVVHSRVWSTTAECCTTSFRNDIPSGLCSVIICCDDQIDELIAAYRCSDT